MLSVIDLKLELDAFIKRFLNDVVPEFLLMAVGASQILRPSGIREGAEDLHFLALIGPVLDPRIRLEVQDAFKHLLVFASQFGLRIEFWNAISAPGR